MAPKCLLTISRENEISYLPRKVTPRADCRDLTEVMVQLRLSPGRISRKSSSPTSTSSKASDIRHLVDLPQA
jgi:hypothetical protein